MASDVIGKGLGVVAVYEEQLESMDHDEKELDHLDGRQIFLPPKELLILWAERSEEVIRIHDDMYESVDQPEESGMTAGQKLEAPPH